MAYGLEVKDEANLEIIEAYLYYEEKRTGLEASRIAMMVRQVFKKHVSHQHYYKLLHRKVCYPHSFLLLLHLYFYYSTLAFFTIFGNGLDTF